MKSKPEFNVRLLKYLDIIDMKFLYQPNLRVCFITIIAIIVYFACR